MKIAMVLPLAMVMPSTRADVSLPAHALQSLSLPNKCLDVPGGGAIYTSNMELWVWDCLDADNQKFQFIDGRLNYLQDVSKCVDLLHHNISAGASVVLNDCVEGKPSQQWGYDASAKTVFLAGSDADSTLCLKLTERKAPDSDGIFVELAACSAELSSQWLRGDLQPSPAPAPTPPHDVSPLPAHAVQARMNHKCLDVPGGGQIYAPGEKLWLWDCLDSDNQKFQLFNGALIYLNDISKCVDLEQDNMATGSKLVLNSCIDGKSSQQWGYDAGVGTLFLASSSGDATKCVEVTSEKAPDSPGIFVALNECVESQEQFWNLGGLQPAPLPSPSPPPPPMPTPSPTPVPPSPPVPPPSPPVPPSPFTRRRRSSVVV